MPSNPDSIEGSIRPASPSRPGRNKVRSERDDRGGVMLPLIVIIGFCAVAYGVWVAAFDRPSAAEASAKLNKAIAASKRAARAAKSAVETKVREPELARKGLRQKRGPAFAQEDQEARERHEKLRKELAKRGLTPPLLASEVDKVFSRARKNVHGCYRKHFPKLGNFRCVRVDADINADGKVTAANLVDDDANDATRACVTKAVKRLRFRGKREHDESHQIFLVMGKVKRVKR